MMASESTTSGPSLLLLFIHGFLGSEHTFHSFPADLKEYLSTTRKVNVHCRVLPRFDTKGDSAAAVTKLISQIKSAATEEAIPPYSRVMLLGHSMGGIMAVDAWSQLTKNTLSSTSDPLPYKIAGIACFDTPFFGLHHKVFSTAAGEHAVSIVKSLVPELPPAPPVPNPLPLLTNAGAKSIALATEMGSKSMYLASQVGSKSVSIFQEAGASALAVSSKSTLQALSASSSILNRLSTIKIISSKNNPASPSENNNVVCIEPSTQPPYSEELPKDLVDLASNSVSEVTSSSITTVSTPSPPSSSQTMAFESGQNLAKNTIEAGVNAASQAVKLTMGLGSFFRTTSSSSANIPSKTVIEAGAFQEKDIPLPHSSTPSIILSSLIPTSLFSKQIHSTPSVSESSSIDAESPSHNPDSQKQQQKQQQLPESSEIFKDQVDFELSNDQQVAGIDFYSPAAAAATVAKQQEITETEVVLDEEIPPLSGDKPEPSWYPWLIAGSVLVAGAAGAYYVGAGSVVYGVVASSYVRSAASSAASTAAIYVANEVSRHLQFLYPLYGTKEQLASRVRKVSEAAEQEKLVFGCLYVQLPPSASAKSTATTDTKPTLPTTGTDGVGATLGEEKMRTFIVTPPQDLCHLFTPVTSSLSDEIAAHTLLFDRNSNTDYYYVLLMETAKLVEKTVTVAIKG